MKILMIGGTGNISSYVTEQCLAKGYEVVLLNRGTKLENIPAGARIVQGDIHQEAEVAAALQGENFDVVANFINYVPEHIERDIRLFEGKTKQYIFISSASAYQKPLSHYLVTESTPLANPYWQYSRDKIACEDRLMKEYREKGFPVTIVRPSHTYAHRLPVAMQGKNGCWQVMKRMMDGKPLILHGDGMSLWTLTHSKDVAKGIVGLMGNVHAIGEAVHITSDETITWNKAYEIMGNCLGVKPVIYHLPTEIIARYYPDYEGKLFGDLANSVVFDNSKIKRLVPGFCADIRFDQGCQMAVDYVMAHPEMHVEDKAFDDECEHLISIYKKML